MIAVNEALDSQVEVLAAALRNPNAQLSGLQGALTSLYRELLLQGRASKRERAANGVRAARANHKRGSSLMIIQSCRNES